jgi:hypothetical protein
MIYVTVTFKEHINGSALTGFGDMYYVHTSAYVIMGRMAVPLTGRTQQRGPLPGIFGKPTFISPRRPV